MDESLETLDIHAHFPMGMVWRMDRLVRLGEYSSRSELIRDSVRRRLVELEKERGTEPKPEPPHAPLARASNHHGGDHRW